MKPALGLLALVLSMTAFGVQGALENGIQMADANAAETGVFVSVSLEDLQLVNQVGQPVVLLSLFRDGDIRDSQERSLTPRAGIVDLTGLSASFESAEGDFFGHRLGAEIRVDGSLVLGLSGQPVAEGGETKFRVTSLLYPPNSTLESTGDRLMTFRSGYSSDDITVGFTPAPDVPGYGLVIRLEAASVVPPDETPVVFSTQTIGPKRTTYGNFVASFRVERLPPTIKMTYSLLHEGAPLASAWMVLDMPTGRSWDSGNDPGTPPAALAYGAVHDVDDHATSVTLPDTVLTNSFPLRSLTEVGRGFSGVAGTLGDQLAKDLFPLPKQESTSPVDHNQTVDHDVPSNATEGSHDIPGPVSVTADDVGAAALKAAAFVLGVTLLVALLVGRRWRF